MMRAIVVTKIGGPDILTIGEMPRPRAGVHELLVRVRAAGINRAEIMQRRGRAGEPTTFEPKVLGLELAGEIVECGGEVSRFKPGDRVMGISDRTGSYAEFACLDERTAIPVPDTMTDVQAGATVEAFVTAHEALVHLGGLSPEGTALIHAAGSGVSTAAIQMAREIGAYSIVTAGSAEKLDRALNLGATHAINYKTQDFALVARELMGGKGLHVVVDYIGAPYLERNLSVLRPGGRLVQVGLLGGAQAQIPLDVVLHNHLSILGTVMKSRPLPEKRAMVQRFADRWWASLAAGRLAPIIDCVMPLDAAAAAHQRMEQNLNFGKIVLTM